MQVNSTAEEPPEPPSRPDHAKRLAKFRAMRRRHVIERLREEARVTGNPLYAWEAILECLIGDIQFPAWCMEYLKHTAIQIRLLREQIYSSVGEHPNNRPPPKALVDRLTNSVPAALQMRRTGWNAFRQYSADRCSEQDASTVLFDAIAAGSLPQPPAVQRIAERRGFSAPSRAHLVRRQILAGMKFLSAHERAMLTEDRLSERKERTKPDP